MESCVVVLFRNDLRITDHEPLLQAVQTGLPIAGLYCFDPRQFQKTAFGFHKTERFRARFLIESVQNLRERLEERGGTLLVRIGTPEDVIQELKREMAIQAVYCYEETGSEEQLVEEELRRVLEDVPLHTYFGKTLYDPNDLPFSITNIPHTFSSFRKKVEGRVRMRPVQQAPATIQGVKVKEAGHVPSLQELGLDEKGGTVLFRGGETEGRKRISYYLFETDYISRYKETRNGLIETDDSSKFSPWLAHGCLSPRMIYEEIMRYESERGANDSTYWLYFELLWRDFFTFIHMKEGNRLFRRNGLHSASFYWEKDERKIRAWIDGETGYPLVDASMRQLYETGFMSNRGRQNTANFFAKLLGQDWRIGAAWFEAMLVDYDVASNYGNWLYVSGIGNDSRSDRIFNVTKQGKDYDPAGEFVKRWIPALRNVPAAYVHEPHRLSEEQQALYEVSIGAYPAPIISFHAALDTYNRRYRAAIKGR